MWGMRVLAPRLRRRRFVILTRMITAPNFAAKTEASEGALALAREVLAIEAGAVAALAQRLDQTFLDGGVAAARLPRPRGGERHRQVGPCRAQDRVDHGEHRHAGLLRASRGGEPRRPRHDRARRRDDRAVQLRRERGTADHRAARQAPGREADRDDRQSGLHAGEAKPTCIWTRTSTRRHARSTSRRRRAPPPRSRWATRWRSRCSMPAASARTTSRARIRAARSAGACSPTSAT